MVGPGKEALRGDALDKAVDYIRQDDRIFEVIMTGGDPLMLSDRRVEYFLGKLRAIPHVEIVRIHT